MSITPTNNNQFPFSSLLFLPTQFEDCAQKIVEYVNKQGLQIGKKIAEGAQGIIFPLSNTTTGEISSVLKIAPPWKCGFNPFDPDQGIHLVAKLKHPNLCIPTQFFYLTPSGEIALTQPPGSTGILTIGTIMPYIDQRDTDLDKAADILDYINQLREAIVELAKNGLEHRDLFRWNILTDKQGRVHVIDFDGCSKKGRGSVFVVRYDHEHLREQFKDLIRDAKNIKPSAVKFLLDCLERATEEQLLSPTFMQNCLDHLEEIQANPQPKSKL